MIPSPLTSLSTQFPSLKVPINTVLDKATCVLFGENLHLGDWTRFHEMWGTTLKPISGWRIAGLDVLVLDCPFTLEFQQLCAAFHWDLASLNHTITLKAQGLLVMDMDSTAIQIECIDEIAKLAGVGEEVSKVTEAAMQGELDFEASLRQRVSALSGTSENVLERVLNNLPLMPGLTDLTAFLHHQGWYLAIASGGFTYFSEVLRSKLDLCETKANKLEICDGILTGNIVGDVVDAQSKADFLKTLAHRYQIPMRNTIAIGDGANDLPMIAEAGLGIAFRAKQSVQNKAPMKICFTDLRGVIAVLSVSLYSSHH